MPSTSERQRRFFGAELSRKRHGMKTTTKMSTEQLREFAQKPVSKSVAKPKGKHGKGRR